MIYGANGYSGELIAREACSRGLEPVLAGRNPTRIEALANELSLEARVFALDDPDRVGSELDGMKLVLHCAGPFSATSRPMVDACLKSATHYLDITGEIDVFEAALARSEEATAAGIILCPGVGFDVIPTDCLAACLAEALPDANQLALAFCSSSGLSPGTAKTSVEGLASGGKVRRDGRIVTVALGYKTRQIDFGSGPRNAVTIPWGDVSTAFHTTRIPNIEVYLEASPARAAQMRKMRWFQPLLKFAPIQSLIKGRIGKKVKGPSEEKRSGAKTAVWGEVTNAAGQKKTGTLTTANGYDVTVTGSLGVVEYLLKTQVEGGAITPARLVGNRFVCSLPGSSQIHIE